MTRSNGGFNHDEHKASGEDAAPPHSPESECAVLGVGLADPTRWPEIAATLRPEDFYVPLNREYFETIDGSAKGNHQFDLLIIAERLSTARGQDRGVLAELAELSKFAADAISAGTLPYHIGKLRELGRKRRALKLASQLAREVYGEATVQQIAAALLPTVQSLAGELELSAAKPESIFSPARAPIGMKTFDETQPPPEFVVDGLFPCDIGAELGAGGASKSTKDLWESVHIIMGWKLYGREVLRPGKVLIVSAEDNVARIRFRLRMLCEQFSDLTRAAKEHIATSLLVEDLTGKGVRLVALDRDGNLTQTGAVDALIDAYAGAGLSLVSFDPFVYFGPGERYVNDAEAAMAQAAHRICNGLNCTVRYVHHTGKQNAREGRTDQYANRGGSALPDGMRFVHVLSRAEQRIESTPAQISDEDLIKGRVLTLHAPKVTDGPPILEPIWIRRTGWRFEHIVARQTDDRNLELDRQRRLFDFVDTQSRAGIRHTVRSLETNAKTIGFSRDGLRSAVHAALELGYLAEMALPKEEQEGAKKHYLAAATRP